MVSTRRQRAAEEEASGSTAPPALRHTITARFSSYLNQYINCQIKRIPGNYTPGNRNGIAIEPLGLISIHAPEGADLGAILRALKANAQSLDDVVTRWSNDEGKGASVPEFTDVIIEELNKRFDFDLRPSAKHVRRSKRNNTILLRLHDIYASNFSDKKIMNGRWRSPPLEIDGPLEHEELLQLIKTDPRRWLISLSPAAREALDLSDETLSLAATPLTPAHASMPAVEDQELDFDFAARRDKNLDRSADSARIISENSSLAKACWPVKTYCEGISEAVRAHEAGEDFDFGEWLRQRAYDPALPQIFPTIKSSRRGVWSVGVIHRDVRKTKVFYDHDDMEEARDVIEGIIADRQLEHGRDWFNEVSNILAIFNDFLSELGLAEDGQGSTEDICEGKNCSQGSHTCHWEYPSAVHAKDRRFSCAEMYGPWCLHHHAQIRALSVSPLIYRSEERQAIRGIGQYDSRRGFRTDATAIFDGKDKLEETIYPCYDFNLDPAEFEKAALAEDPVAALVALAPNVLSNDLLNLEHSPVVVGSGKAQVARLAALLIKANSTSVDLKDQFNDAEGGDGGVLPHSMTSCVRNPRWTQKRRSGHMFVFTCVIAAINIKSALDQGLSGVIEQEARALLPVLRGLIEKFQPVEQIFRGTKHMGARLTSEQAALSRAGHACVRKKWCPEDAAALQGFDPLAVPIPPPDMAGSSTTYRSKRTFETLIDKLADDDDDEAKLKDLTQNLIDDAEMIARKDAGIERRIADKFAVVADAVVARYPNTTLDRNALGMPLLVGTDATTTMHVILTWLVVVWTRAVTVCDFWTMVRCGIIVWRRRAWWRIAVTAMVIIAQRGGIIDALCAFALVVSAQVYHPLRLAFAHRQHHRYFYGGPSGGGGGDDTFPDNVDLQWFETANATFQAGLINDLIGSKTIGELKGIIAATKAPTTEFLRRLAEIGVAKPSPDTIAAIEKRPAVLSAAQTQEVKLNGVPEADAVWL